MGDWSNSWGMIGQFFYILLMLAIVSILAWVSAKLAASVKKGRVRGRRLELIESLHLNQQACLNVVRAGDKWYLLGSTKENVSLIAELTREEVEIASGEGAKTIFEAHLAKFLNRKEEGA
jgi:flagellar protein FliO/FliZ